MAVHSRLDRAKDAKKDEFYTRLTDIEKELRFYRKHFKGKTVFCNCDDPFESKFFEYFVKNFNKLGLAKLIATCYAGSPIAGKQLSLFDVVPEAEPGTPYKAVVTKVYDANEDGYLDMFDVKELFISGENELSELEEDGDFRSKECLELLDECDIVVTNPPFSIWRQYVDVLMKHKKKFIIVGNKNAVSYKEIFPLFMKNEMWVGQRSMNEDFWLYVPDDYEYEREDEDGRHIKHIMACWYTNLDIKKRHEEMILVKRYSPELYPTYDNYDAINVDSVADIPCDYPGVMGVPITFMDKYNPDQFEILNLSRYLECDGMSKEFVDTYYAQGNKGQISEGHPDLCYYTADGKAVVPYMRILIRNKHPEPPKEK